jgi:hypothetical protein
MSHCTQCGHARASRDRFCSTCGHPHDGAPAAPHAERAARRPAFVPALRTPDGAKVHDALVRRKRRRTIQFRVVLSACALLGLGGAWWLMRSGGAWPLALGATVVSGLLMVLVDPRRWREAEYYSVPGSRDADGEHRCIHCGHRGIHRHGKYRSNTTYADCSRCKEPLWVD